MKSKWCVACIVWFNAAMPFGASAGESEYAYCVAYDNCGVEGLQPHCVKGELGPSKYWRYEANGLAVARRDVFTLKPEQTWSQAPAKTRAVVYRYPYLLPDARYRLRMLFHAQRDTRQSVTANGTVIADDIELQANTPVWKTYDLPAEVYANGSLELRITSATDEPAVVSAIELYSDRPLYPHRVAVDDCGREGHQPNLFVGESKTVLPEKFREQSKWASLPHDDSLRTVNIAKPPARTVIYRYEKLRPEARYQVRVTYFSPDESRQALAADRTLLHPVIFPTPGQPLTVTGELDPADYADGQIDLWIFIRNPLMVHVAKIELYSDQPDLAKAMPTPLEPKTETVKLPPLEPSWRPTTDYDQLSDSPWRWRGWTIAEFYFEPYGNRKHYREGGQFRRAAHEMEVQQLVTPMWREPKWLNLDPGQVQEWGYSLNLINGLTGRQCYTAVRRWYLDQKQRAEDEGKRHFMSTTGQSMLCHYPAKWGCDLIQLEVGTGIQYTQAHVAFGRGAARQYDIPFSVAVSPWRTGLPAYRAGLDEYTPVPDDVPPPGESRRYWNGGRSPSLIERMWYMGWLSGAALVRHGDGFGSMFAWTDSVMSKKIPVPDAPDQRAALSPIGERAQRFMRMITEHPDVGVPYTPFALYLDEYAGWTNGAPFKLAPWTMLEPADGDHQVQMLFEVMWPEARFPPRDGVFDDYEHYQLSRSPFGDTLDVLLSDAGNDVLNFYPVMLVLGDHEFSQTARQVLRRYLTAGGRLILSPTNARKLHDEHLDKLGRVDVIDLPPGDSPAGHAQLAELMRRLSEQYLPVNVTGDVEYMINRTSTGWIVALINNEGITKKGIGPVVLDPTKTQNVQLRLQRAALDAAREWRTNTTPQITDNAVTLTIPPGQIRIVELTTQR